MKHILIGLFIVLPVLCGCDSEKKSPKTESQQAEPLQHGINIVFEFRLPSDDVKELQADLAKANKSIANAPDEKKQWLLDSANRIKADIELAQAAVKSEDSLAQKMVRILDKRIDPKGDRQFEWRPVAKNRIEVRMPSPPPATQAAKDAYLLAIQVLGSRNIEKSDMRSLEQGRTTVEKLAGPDKILTNRLNNLLSTYKTLDQKRKAGETKIQQYILNWEDAEIDILKHNINTQALKSILSGYVRPADLDKVRNQPKAKSSLYSKINIHNRSISSFRAQYRSKPEHLKKIDKAINLYKTWTDIRQELEDPSDLIRLITMGGELEFRIAPVVLIAASNGQKYLSNSERDMYIKILRNTIDKTGPQGLARRVDRYIWCPIMRGLKHGFASMMTAEYAGQKYLLLCNFKGKTLLQRRSTDNWALTNAYLSSDARGFPAIGFKMNAAGAKLLHTLTLSNQGGHLAILLDGTVYSAPVIQCPISSDAIIAMGRSTPEEVGSLIKILKAGVLPAKIKSEPISSAPFGQPSNSAKE